MPEISSTAPLIQQVHAKVALQSNPLMLKVAAAEEPFQAPVELLKGEVEIPKFQVKKCTGILAEMGAVVRGEHVRRGAVDSDNQLVELICEQCGATLPRAPVIGIDVPCPYCKRVWKVTDIVR